MPRPSQKSFDLTTLPSIAVAQAVHRSMDSFISCKRRKLSTPPPISQASRTLSFDEDDSTDMKLATLASMYPELDPSTLLDVLITAEGSVEVASKELGIATLPSPRKRSASRIGYQTSLSRYRSQDKGVPDMQASKPKMLTRKGQTLHLYTPEDIAAHTPCSIIHNFLPAQDAEDLLRELLDEAPTFERQIFKLFDNVVQSPHSACFYVDSDEEQIRQRTEYLYNGSYLTVRDTFWRVPLRLKSANVHGK